MINQDFFKLQIHRELQVFLEAEIKIIKLIKFGGGVGKVRAEGEWNSGGRIARKQKVQWRELCAAALIELQNTYSTDFLLSQGFEP